MTRTGVCRDGHILHLARRCEWPALRSNLGLISARKFGPAGLSHWEEKRGARCRFEPRFQLNSTVSLCAPQRFVPDEQHFNSWTRARSYLGGGY